LIPDATGAQLARTCITLHGLQASRLAAYTRRQVATFSLHARRAAEAARNAKLLAQLARAKDAPRFERPRSAADAGDERTLRGLPAIGRGVSGAVLGTNPAAS
jgi:hypothetical protein